MPVAHHIGVLAVTDDVLGSGHHDCQAETFSVLTADLHGIALDAVGVHADHFGIRSGHDTYLSGIALEDGDIQFIEQLIDGLSPIRCGTCPDRVDNDRYPQLICPPSRCQHRCD